MELASLSAHKLPLAFRGLVFTLLWGFLTDNAASSWWFGVPAIVFATGLSVWLIPPVTLSWLEVARFVPFYLLHSLIGGLDVAWRAFHPRLPIQPELVSYPLRLPEGLPQVLMVNTISLLPGTLIAELTGEEVKIHLLDSSKHFIAEIEAVESRVARMFRATLEEGTMR